MKENRKKIESMVQTNREVPFPEKIDRLWVVQFGQLRRHSRVLYIPLDPTVVRLFHLKKGDILKYMVFELRRAPDEDEPLRDPGVL
jgi:hypothetical protein